MVIGHAGGLVVGDTRLQHRLQHRQEGVHIGKLRALAVAAQRKASPPLVDEVHALGHLIQRTVRGGPRAVAHVIEPGGLQKALLVGDGRASLPLPPVAIRDAGGGKVGVGVQNGVLQLLGQVRLTLGPYSSAGVGEIRDGVQHELLRLGRGSGGRVGDAPLILPDAQVGQILDRQLVQRRGQQPLLHPQPGGEEVGDALDVHGLAGAAPVLPPVVDTGVGQNGVLVRLGDAAPQVLIVQQQPLELLPLHGEGLAIVAKELGVAAASIQGHQCVQRHALKVVHAVKLAHGVGLAEIELIVDEADPVLQELVQTGVRAGKAILAHRRQQVLQLHRRLPAVVPVEVLALQRALRCAAGLRLDVGRALVCPGHHRVLQLLPGYQLELVHAVISAAAGALGLGQYLQSLLPGRGELVGVGKLHRLVVAVQLLAQPAHVRVVPGLHPLHVPADHPIQLGGGDVGRGKVLKGVGHLGVRRPIPVHVHAHILQIGVLQHLFPGRGGRRRAIGLAGTGLPPDIQRGRSAGAHAVVDDLLLDLAPGHRGPVRVRPQGGGQGGHRIVQVVQNSLLQRRVGGGAVVIIGHAVGLHPVAKAVEEGGRHPRGGGPVAVKGVVGLFVVVAGGRLGLDHIERRQHVAGGVDLHLDVPHAVVHPAPGKARAGAVAHQIGPVKDAVGIPRGAHDNMPLELMPGQLHVALLVVDPRRSGGRVRVGRYDGVHQILRIGDTPGAVERGNCAILIQFEVQIVNGRQGHRGGELARGISSGSGGGHLHELVKGPLGDKSVRPLPLLVGHAVPRAVHLFVVKVVLQIQLPAVRPVLTCDNIIALIVVHENIIHSPNYAAGGQVDVHEVLVVGDVLHVKRLGVRGGVQILVLGVKGVHVVGQARLHRRVPGPPHPLPVPVEVGGPLVLVLKGKGGILGGGVVTVPGHIEAIVHRSIHFVRQQVSPRLIHRLDNEHILARFEQAVKVAKISKAQIPAGIRTGGFIVIMAGAGQSRRQSPRLELDSPPRQGLHRRALVGIVRLVRTQFACAKGGPGVLRLHRVLQDLPVLPRHLDLGVGRVLHNGPAVDIRILPRLRVVVGLGHGVVLLHRVLVHVGGVGGVGGAQGVDDVHPLVEHIVQLVGQGIVVPVGHLQSVAAVQLIGILGAAVIELPVQGVHHVFVVRQCGGVGGQLAAVQILAGPQVGVDEVALHVGVDILAHVAALDHLGADEFVGVVVVEDNELAAISAGRTEGGGVHHLQLQSTALGGAIQVEQIAVIAVPRAGLGVLLVAVAQDLHALGGGNADVLHILDTRRRGHAHRAVGVGGVRTRHGVGAEVVIIFRLGPVHRGPGGILAGEFGPYRLARLGGGGQAVGVCKIAALGGVGQPSQRRLAVVEEIGVGPVQAQPEALRLGGVVLAGDLMVDIGVIVGGVDHDGVLGETLEVIAKPDHHHRGGGLEHHRLIVRRVSRQGHQRRFGVGGGILVVLVHLGRRGKGAAVPLGVQGDGVGPGLLQRGLGHVGEGVGVGGAPHLGIHVICQNNAPGIGGILVGVAGAVPLAVCNRLHVPVDRSEDIGIDPHHRRGGGEGIVGHGIVGLGHPGSPGLDIGQSLGILRLRELLFRAGGITGCRVGAIDAPGRADAQGQLVEARRRAVVVHHHIALDGDLRLVLERCLGDHAVIGRGQGRRGKQQGGQQQRQQASGPRKPLPQRVPYAVEFLCPHCPHLRFSSAFSSRSAYRLVLRSGRYPQRVAKGAVGVSAEEKYLPTTVQRDLLA